jgi:polysaccharide pyruvyl transferase WcaK-like protein/sulfatase maturation enzyme AslB (radical SAM superfamily)
MKKPKVIQFPINNICNSRCQMCDIWRQQKAHEITPLELREILSDPLFSEVRGVGINGGEPTLRPDLADLAQELINGLPKLRGISLITNGLRPHLVIPRASELYGATNRAGIKLDIMLSLDGVGDVHDRVRGRTGNFDAVEECLGYFRANNIGDSLRLGCTLISENIEDAERLMLWAEQQGIYCRFRVGIPHQRLYTNDKPQPFSLTDRQNFHLCNFLDTLVSRYEKTRPQRRLYLKNLRDQIAYKTPRANGCAWQDEGVTLLSDGGLAYCAVESPTLGNLVDGDATASTVYFGNHSIREQIISDKCDSCLHDYEGRIPRIADRAVVRAQQVLLKANLPLKPFRAIYSSAGLARNSVKLLDKPNLALGNPSQLLQKNRILIVGWYGTETLGDKAILYSVIQELKKVGICPSRIYVASIEPYVTQYSLSEYEPVSDCSVVSLSDAERMAKAGQFGQVIFGGGPIMSSIGYLIPIASIFRAVKRVGGQAVVWGCGLGPIRQTKKDFVNKIAIRQILRASDHCVFRDLKSLETAKTFVGAGFGEHWAAALDPAFHWVKSVSPSNSQPHSVDGKATGKVGFAIRDLPVAEYFSDFDGDVQELKQEFDSAMASLMDRHSSVSSVYLQCMHRLPCGGDDRLFYYDLLGAKAGEYGLTFEHKNPIQDVSDLSGLDRLYAMRFHSVVFGLALGIPVVPIDYTNGGKIASLCRALAIRCWTPSEFVEEVRSAGAPPAAQYPDKQLLDFCIAESQAVYGHLARTVACFVGA